MNAREHRNFCRNIGEKYDYETVVIAKEMDGNRKISSTYIREELKKGNMEKITGSSRKTFFACQVELNMAEGWDTGISFLLANIIPPKSKLMPPNGVYVTSVSF